MGMVLLLLRDVLSLYCSFHHCPRFCESNTTMGMFGDDHDDGDDGSNWQLGLN